MVVMAVFCWFAFETSGNTDVLNWFLSVWGNQRCGCYVVIVLLIYTGVLHSVGSPLELLRITPISH